MREPGTAGAPGRGEGPAGLSSGLAGPNSRLAGPNSRLAGPNSSPGPEASGTLWLVRHGQSGWNVSGRVQGQSPNAPGLTAAGREQAAVAARELEYGAPRASLIVASDLARAAETADIIAAILGIPVEYDPDLREQALGVLEGLVAASPAAAGITGAPSAAGEPLATGAPSAAGEPLAAGAPEDALDVLWRRPFQRPPGGESVADMYGRVHRALGRITASRPGAELIIVTHGGPVRVATAPPPSPGRPMARTLVENASITRWPPAGSPAR